MTEKRILLVDADREVTRTLREALLSFDSGLEVVRVPSGEEAVLELGRRSYDLILTDAALPGVDGVELIHQMRDVSPGTEIIVVTGNASTELQREISVYHPLGYFIKPVDTVVLMDMVQLTFFRKLRHTVEARVEAVPKLAAEMQSDQTISERLTELRRDLGALAVFLVDSDGDIVVRAGDVSAVNLESMMGQLKVVFNAAIKVSQMLGETTGRNAFFIDGSATDVYVLNVGEYFMLVTLFGSQAGSNKLGPVMRYGRQCTNDLLEMMDRLGLQEAEAAKQTGPLAQPPAPKPATGGLERGLLADALAGAAPDESPAVAPASEPVPVAAGIEDFDLDKLMETADQVAPDSPDDFWAKAVEEDETTAGDASALSFEQAQKLGLFDEE